MNSSQNQVYPCINKS